MKKQILFIVSSEHGATSVGGEELAEAYGDINPILFRDNYYLNNFIHFCDENGFRNTGVHEVNAVAVVEKEENQVKAEITSVYDHLAEYFLELIKQIVTEEYSHSYYSFPNDAPPKENTFSIEEDRDGEILHYSFELRTPEGGEVFMI